MNSTKYPRPTKLSDPGRDFTPELLEEILSVPANKMGEFELGCLFQGGLPAGTYEEVVHFLPNMLDFLRQKKEPETMIVEDFLWWVDEFQDCLRADNYLQVVLEEIFEIFGNYFSEFKTEDFCAWRFYYRYDKVVVYSYFARFLLRNFPNAEVFLERQLTPMNSYPQATWFFMFLKEFYDPEKNPWRESQAALKNCALIKKWAADLELKSRAKLIIRSRAPAEERSFWDAFFDWLSFFE